MSILKSAELTFITFLWLFINTGLNSQISSSHEGVSFNIKAWDPVHVVVNEKGVYDNTHPMRFTATNSTYYPFMLLIDFIQFTNLAPKPPVQATPVSHGLNNLFNCSLQVPGTGYAMQYQYSYWIRPSDKNINGEFPYLIPIREGRTVCSKKTSDGRIGNTFVGQKGDTVYCMRRGLVTAVPRTETIEFRLTPHNCLEVLHDDGTYLFYYNLKKSENITNVGETVLPGQPVGSLSDSSYLKVDLVKVENEKNLLISIPIRYTTGKSVTSSYDELDGVEKSVFPAEVITREMRGRELKKYKVKH